jgi:dihydropteroate synthase
MMTTQPRVCRLDGPADARRLMARAGVSTKGIEIMAPKLRGVTLHLAGLRFATATILKQEALVVGAEAAVHKDLVVRRTETTDVILGGSLTQLYKLCAKLRGQQFGLSALADELERVLAVRDAAPVWHLRGRRLTLDEPLVMGIVNLTADSFSGDGLAADTAAAVERARAMLEAGAAIIDVGAESTRPGAEPVDAETELERLLPVVRGLVALPGAVISVDTYKPAVAEACLAAGVQIINDVTGLRGPDNDDAMARVAAEYGAGVVVMHMQGSPRDMQRDPWYDDLGRELHDFFLERLRVCVGAGLPAEAVALDPGIGFGKRLEHNLALLNHPEWFSGLGRPIVVGASRKSFIGGLTAAPVGERLPGTLAAHTVALLRGAHLLRVHDVPQAVQALRVAAAIEGAGQ